MLKELFGGHLVQPLLKAGLIFVSEQVAQSHSQLSFENLQGRRFSGQSVPSLNHPHCEFLPCIQLKFSYNSRLSTFVFPLCTGEESVFPYLAL